MTIPLPDYGSMASLDRRRELTEVVELARRHPTSRISLSAYVKDEDTRVRHSDAVTLGDELVIQAARHISARGIDPERISGKGMGVNATIGRAIVATIEPTLTAPRHEPNPRQLAEQQAASSVPDRLPSENRSFKEVGGITEYRVGPGDVLKITSHRLAGAQEFTAPVGPLGTVSFDLVEDAPVNGLTVTEVESLFKSMLKRYYRNPRLTVAVSGYGSRSITLIQPSGAKTVALAGRTTVFDLIVQQNLPTGIAGPGVADLKGIRVTRGTTEYKVNAFQIVDSHDWKENLVLEEGDVVYIPSFTQVGDYITVLGAVRAPGIYPMPTRYTAAQALFVAGGALRTAYLPHARIVRGDRDHPEILPADVDLVINQGLMRADQYLKAGDVLYVPATRIANFNEAVTDIYPAINLATLPLRFLYLGNIFGSQTSSETTVNQTTINNPPPSLTP